MCGIVGYIGAKDTNPILLKALSRLEYRGYDSAGLATVSDAGLTLLKAPGKIHVLQKLAARNPLRGHLGIGHTRWATHGEPSERNAHPHADCTGTIAVVHNGIIENHAILRKRLIDSGHRFSSETDTEVLSHLIEEYYLKDSRDLEHSVRLALQDLEGSYAFCVVSAKDPDRFIAARNASPLVVGLGEGENFIASDAPAILDYTRRIIFLEDYQTAVVSRNGVKVTSQEGEPVKPTVIQVDWSEKDATKDGFDHFMLKEIEEQPKVIERMIKTRIQDSSDLALFDILNFPEDRLKQVKRIMIQACGTSWHAALTGKFFFEAISGLPCEVDVSSEFRYRSFVPPGDTLLISITQSGETIDTLMGLRRGKGNGLKTISICNVLGSTVARESDAVIYTQAGPEIGVASTKTYTAQLGILFLLSIYWARLRNHSNGFDLDRLIAEFKTIPEKIYSIIRQKEKIRSIAEYYSDARDFLFLARGIQYPNAHEGALKIKEIAYIHATGHPAGEMKHGPIALIDERMPVVVIATDSSIYEKMVSNIREVKARAGKVIAIATEGNESIRAFVDHVIYVPKTHELLSPLLAALPLQYLAYFVAVRRGTDIDQPRNLAKSVTVE